MTETPYGMWTHIKNLPWQVVTKHGEDHDDRYGVGDCNCDGFYCNVIPANISKELAEFIVKAANAKPHKHFFEEMDFRK